MFLCNNCNEEIEFINAKPTAENGHFMWTHTDGATACVKPEHLPSYAVSCVAEIKPEDIQRWWLEDSNYDKARQQNLEAVRDELARPLIPTVENDGDKRVEVLVYIPHVGHSVFTNVPLSIVNEAIAHINDNS